jgi:predicted RecB family nuclease
MSVEGPFPRRITEQDLAGGAVCLHRWYLECHGTPAFRRPDPAPDPRDDSFKRQCVAWLSDLREPVWDGRTVETGRHETLKLMEKGPAWIYGGVLADAEFVGRPDLLKRVERPSAVGPFSYAPAMLKQNSCRLETADVRALQLQALLLEPILGHLPSEGWLYRPDGLSMEVDLKETWPSFLTTLEDFRRIARGEILTEGYRCSECPRCPWSGHCRKVWTQLSHVCLLPGMDRALQGMFRDAGYASWPAIADSSTERISQDVGVPLPAARLLWLHAKAFRSRRPLVIQSAPFPGNIPIHFYAPEFRGGRCALHGDLRVLRGETRTRQFLAPTPAQEGAAWRAFLDDLARDERALVFTWTNRIAKPLESLWKRHGGNRQGWRLLNRGRRSLHRFLREQVILPLSSYGLRDVAEFFSYKWPSRPNPPAPFLFPWERDDGFPEIASSRAFLDANRDRIGAMKSVYFGLQLLQDLGGAESA